jgi:sortilin (neurotensin receptor 3)
MAALVGALGLLAIRGASANGRLPAANRIVFSPTNPKLVITRATYGLLPSFDDGATWAFLCEDALGLPQMATEDPAMGLTATNALVTGLQMPAGLEVSTDNGCNWRCAGGSIANESIVDIAVRPDAPDTVVALTNTPLADEAGGGARLQVFRSTDDGATWAPLGVPLDPAVLATTIDVAPSDPHRLYVSGTRGFGPTRTASLFVSVDDGATWTEVPAPLDTSLATAVYIGGVDPLDPDRVYLRTNGASRLYVTAPLDGGLAFEAILTLSDEMLGFALSPDGSKIYAGSEMAGLFVGDRTTMTFRHVSSVVTGTDGGARDIHVQCLAARAGELWACADEPSGFLVGASTDDGATFSPKLHLDGVQAPIRCSAAGPISVACGADANASQCGGAPFTNLCAAVGCKPTGPAPPRSSCGCVVVGAQPSSPTFALLVGALFVAGRLARIAGAKPKRSARGLRVELAEIHTLGRSAVLHLADRE